MNGKIKKEIDVIDLLLNWIEHWKSLVGVVILGVILACGYLFLFTADESPKENTESVADLAKGKFLSELTQEQLAKVSLKDMEKYFLSEKDIVAVDEVIYLQGEYEKNVEEYNNKKDDEDLKDRAETFSYIANTKNIVETRRASLTADQQVYYNAKLDLDAFIGEKIVGAENGNVAVSGNGPVKSKKKAVLIILLAIILHFFVIGLKYVFDKKIKHSDELSQLFGIPEFTRVIDWERIDSSRGLDKIVNKFRFASVRRNDVKETIKINVSTTLDILKKKRYSSVALVGSGIDVERLDFISQIVELDNKIVVKSLDSVTHSVNGAESIEGVESAILVARVGLTKYSEFMEELLSLKSRGVDIIGIAVFE